MQTKLSKYSDYDTNFPAKWVNYFHAGTSWLMTLQLLIENREEVYGGIFNVEPTIIALCLELFTKALVAHEDKNFNGHDLKHATIKIMQKYQGEITIFQDVLDDADLLSVFEEYEREAIGLRYGEAGGNFANNEKRELINLIYKLRQEMCDRTGLC